MICEGIKKAAGRAATTEAAVDLTQCLGNIACDRLRRMANSLREGRYDVRRAVQELDSRPKWPAAARAQDGMHIATLVSLWMRLP